MQQVKKFGVLQTSKVIAVFYLIFSAVFCIPFGVISFIIGKPGGIFIIFLPLLYAALGFVAIAGSCLFYNFIARKIGGIEVEIKPD